MACLYITNTVAQSYGMTHGQPWAKAATNVSVLSYWLEYGIGMLSPDIARI